MSNDTVPNPDGTRPQPRPESTFSTSDGESCVVLLQLHPDESGGAETVEIRFQHRRPIERGRYGGIVGVPPGLLGELNALIEEADELLQDVDEEEDD